MYNLFLFLFLIIWLLYKMLGSNLLINDTVKRLGLNADLLSEREGMCNWHSLIRA